MDASPERTFFEHLESRLAGGEPVEIEVPLTLLAGRQVELDADELRAARRRAVQLLAASGDPRQHLDPNGRAVAALAADLDAPERRTALTEGLASLAAAVTGLQQVSARLEQLTSDDELAWRWFACTLVAEELVED
jgi:hypothetical protein